MTAALSPDSCGLSVVLYRETALKLQDSSLFLESCDKLQLLSSSHKTDDFVSPEQKFARCERKSCKSVKNNEVSYEL